VLSDKKAKQKLAARAFPLMTYERLAERDPTGEVKAWMTAIREQLTR
jgi:putative ATP-dependent endonuclease of OLD family